MTTTARRYNPGFLTDDELIDLFCVRTRELESMIEVLAQCDASANTHQIVIGPRGSGKTSLLLRVAVEIRRDPDLATRFLPVVFSEESYEVATAGEFWLECLSRLAGQVTSLETGPDLLRTLEELQQVRDDTMLRERCLGALQDFADRQQRRLVLIVENLNMLFGQIADPDTGWQLRHTLQTDSRIVLLASATSRFDEIDSPEHALYDLFRVVQLRPLDTDDCQTLWQRVTGGRDRTPETFGALRILTGGSPRLLTILGRFGASLSLHELMSDLLDLVDDHTEYFKSHLEALAPQERRVYLALADLWRKATTREIADRARLDTSTCSAHLGRLVRRGAVEEVDGGTPRRKLYYVVERLYNIYYQMRRARGPTPLLEALIQFMEAYYSPSELMDFGARMAREATAAGETAGSLHREAFERLVDVPVLQRRREELLALAPKDLVDRLRQHPLGADRLAKSAGNLAAAGRFSDALTAWVQLVQSVGPTAAPEIVTSTAREICSNAIRLTASKGPQKALEVFDEISERMLSTGRRDVFDAVLVAANHGAVMLAELNRAPDAIAACDKILRRVRESGSVQPEPIAGTLNNKGIILAEHQHAEEALAAWDEALQLCTPSQTPETPALTARILANKAILLDRTERGPEALAAYDELLQRFEGSKDPATLYVIGNTLVDKGVALAESRRHDDALANWDNTIRLCEGSDDAAVRDAAARALANKGALLAELGRPKECLAAWDEVVLLADRHPAPQLHRWVAEILVDKGVLLAQIERPQDAFAAWDAAIRRSAGSRDTNVLGTATRAFYNKGNLLATLERHEEALTVWDDMVQRFDPPQTPKILESVAEALVDRGVLFARTERPEEALTEWGGAINRCAGSENPQVLEVAGRALTNKAVLLEIHGRHEEAFQAWEDIVRRFEASEASGLRKLADSARLNSAAAELALGQRAAQEAVEQALEYRRSTGQPPDEHLRGVAATAVAFGLSLVRELIRSSPPASLLLPLTTALERELGMQTRVAREIEDVAEDIRSHMRQHQPLLGDGLECGDAVLAAWSAMLRRFCGGAAEQREGTSMEWVRAAVDDLPTGQSQRALIAVERMLACIVRSPDVLSRDVVHGLSRIAADVGLSLAHHLVQAAPDAADALLPLVRVIGQEPRPSRQ